MPYMCVQDIRFRRLELFDSCSVSLSRDSEEKHWHLNEPILLEDLFDEEPAARACH